MAEAYGLQNAIGDGHRTNAGVGAAAGHPTYPTYGVARIGTGGGTNGNCIYSVVATSGDLIVSEFFTREHIERFFMNNAATALDSLNERIDYDRVFEHLIEAIVESPMGNMLKMVGGRAALEPLKEPIIVKLKSVVSELASTPAADQEGKQGGDFTGALIAQVEKIIDARLAELTPQMVKTIIEDMIRKHLGWLVLWGGVFGGLIGVVANILQH